MYQSSWLNGLEIPSIEHFSLVNFASHENVVTKYSEVLVSSLDHEH